MLYAWLYFENHFKGCYLPDAEKWTERVAIWQSESGWDRDYFVTFYPVEGRPSVLPPEHFRWESENRAGEFLVAQNGVRCTMRNGDYAIGVLFTECRREDSAFKKYLLPSGSRIGIGRNQNCALRIRAELDTVSKDQGVFEIAPDGSCVYTDIGRNGSYLNGILLSAAATRLRFGDIITYNAGIKIVYLGSILAINHLSAFDAISLKLAIPVRRPPQHSGAPLPPVQVQFHRSPRFLRAPDTETVSIEGPIEKQDHAERPLWLTLGPSATMALPMLAGSAFASSSSYLGTGIAMVGTASVLAVIWALLNYRHRRKTAEETEVNRLEKYKMYISGVEERLRELNETELRRLLEVHPGPEECAGIPQSNRLRLWERMPGHADFLTVRVGLGDVPLPNEIEVPKQSVSLVDDPLRGEPERLRQTYQYISNAPVSLDLKRETVVGILGEELAVSVAQSILLQLAALHSYHDVRIVVLTDESGSSGWSWARWLPHVFTSEDRELRMTVSEPAAVTEVLSHLEETISIRREARQEQGGEHADPAPPLPHYVVFCADPTILDNKPVLRTMLSGTPGMTMVVLASSMELLPKECRIVLDASEKQGAFYTSDGSSRRMDFEYPNAHLLRQFSQMLAPLRVRDSTESAAIPTMVSFLELYGARRVEELEIWRNWTRNHVYEGLRSTIGLGAGSQPFVLDISDKAHGPHGLIAGTTGSGKSVMLQTYILSLAMNYHPDQVRFILIDYKGGGMAQAFAHLPHVTGIIDNLQTGNTIARALASLQGEIHRREQIFSEAGVDYINDYIRFYYDDPEKERLPHLIIVVDEFAELKEDQPDFMRELVSASRVGRSLGVHLILATQKPSNSVSGEIWSNSNFRICLRVQSRNDSMEMLRKPDAAYLKNRGRCYVQIGNDEIYEQVQTSYSGLAYHPDEPSETELPHLLNNAGQRVRTKRRRSAGDVRDQTQMDAVLERIIAAAREHGLPASYELWKEELKAELFLRDLPGVPARPWGAWAEPEPAGLSAVFAMADDVQRQKHFPLYLDFPAHRNYLVVGMASSGKTTLVQTAVLSLALRYSPRALHMYVLSLTSRTLNCLAELPHIGDIIYENEDAELRRLFDLLQRENADRKAMLAAASTDSFLAYNQSQAAQGKPPLPAIVVFADRFAQLVEMLGEEEYVMKLSVLLQEGSSRGIYFLATAMDYKEVNYKLRGSFRGIGLQINDRAEYTEIIGKRLPPEIPDLTQKPGRGAAVADSEVYEFQTALGGCGENDEARAKDVAVVCGELARAWTGPLPRRIPRIPQNPDWTKFSASPRYRQAVQDPWLFPLAYSLGSGDVCSLRLEESYSLLVLGPQRSGKTNLLRLVCRQWAQRGAEVTVLADAAWNQTCRQLGLTLCEPKTEAWSAYIQHLTDTALARAAEFKKWKAGAPEEFEAAAKAMKPLVLVIDDIGKVLVSLGPDQVKFLVQLVTGASKFGIYFYVSVSHMDYTKCKLMEPLPTLVRQMHGVALRGRLLELDPWNLAIPAAQKRKTLPLGQAYLVNNGELSQIVIPNAEE